MKFLTTSSFEVDVYCIEIMVIHEHLYKYFFDDAECLSAIWLCNVQSLNDVCPASGSVMFSLWMMFVRHQVVSCSVSG